MNPTAIGILLSSSLLQVLSFSPQSPVGTNRLLSLTSLRVHQTPSIPISVTGNNIELTTALRDYVNKKLDPMMSKLAAGGVQDCNVHLTVNKNPKVCVCVYVCVYGLIISTIV